MRMIFGAIGGMKIGRGDQVLGENLAQRHFVHHKIPHDQTRARTPDHRGGKPAANRLSYGAALRKCLMDLCFIWYRGLSTLRFSG
jgi:hypothetical protein